MPRTRNVSAAALRSLSLCFIGVSLLAAMLFSAPAVAQEVADSDRPAVPTQVPATEEESPTEGKVLTEDKVSSPGPHVSGAVSAGRTDQAQLHKHPTLLSMLRRNNELRKMVKLPPHRINARLTKAAQDHARYMARTGGFSHYTNGGPQYRARKYRFRGMVRENIAYGYRNVSRAFTGWRNSGGHWASIVSRTTDAGFGYAVSSTGTAYWVAVYGNPVNEPETTTVEPDVFSETVID